MIKIAITEAAFESMGRAGVIVGRTCGLFAVALALAGCSSIQETAFAPNMVRLDVKPYAAPFVREATLRRAAELTLQMAIAQWSTRQLLGVL